mgnify:CR=1 FL=1
MTTHHAAEVAKLHDKIKDVRFPMFKIGRAHV